LIYEAQVVDRNSAIDSSAPFNQDKLRTAISPNDCPALRELYQAFSEFSVHERLFFRFLLNCTDYDLATALQNPLRRPATQDIGTLPSNVVLSIARECVEGRFQSFSDATNLANTCKAWRRLIFDDYRLYNKRLTLSSPHLPTNKAIVRPFLCPFASNQRITRLNDLYACRYLRISGPSVSFLRMKSGICANLL